jgi:leucyl aminopeptidase
MEIHVTYSALDAVAAELLALGLYQEAALPVPLAALDGALGGAIQELVTNGELTGAKGELTLLHTRGAVPAKRVLLVGLGRENGSDLDLWRTAAAKAAQRAQQLGLKSWAMGLPYATDGAEGLAQAAVEGAVLGTYAFTTHKTDLEGCKPAPEALTLVVPDQAAEAAAQAGAQAGRIIAEAVCLARDLINEPGNYLTPSLLAEAAEQMAAELGLQVQILEESEMADLGMGALLGVAQGSNEPAKLIVLEHNAGQADLDTYVVVGKGITFDSGGISLKPSAGMEEMKYDMSGAAATMAVLGAVARLALPLHVVGLIPATENLPGGRAYKPGDVLESMSGQTIEVISTDAEGRLILADTLTYAARFQPKAAVDLATLTGGCVVALGTVTSGLMSSDATLTQQLQLAAQQTAENVWELPLWDAYKEQIKSDVADVKNSGGRDASTITAGLFLARFAQGYPWAHLDIAGTAWQSKTDGYRVKGAAGVGVRLLVQWLRGRCAG